MQLSVTSHKKIVGLNDDVHLSRTLLGFGPLKPAACFPSTLEEGEVVPEGPTQLHVHVIDKPTKKNKF